MADNPEGNGKEHIVFEHDNFYTAEEILDRGLTPVSNDGKMYEFANANGATYKFRKFSLDKKGDLYKFKERVAGR